MFFKIINDRLKILGFQKQLSFSFIVSFVFLTASITLCALFLGKQLASENSLKQAMVITRLFAQQSSLALAYASEESAKEAAKVILTVGNIEQVAMFDSQQDLFYQRGALRHWHITELDQQAWQQQSNPLLEFENDQYWQFVDSVSIGGDTQSDSPYDDLQTKQLHLGYVRVLISKADMHAMVRKMVLGISAMALIILSVMLMLQRKLIRQMTKPLYKLIKAMDSVRLKSDWQPLQTHGAPEWKLIVSAFNQMIVSLQNNETELTKKRDEALEASRLKSEFAANISHELRTPMNGILGTMELLSTMGLDKRQQDYVELAKSSGEHLHILINDILDFSKLDAGFMEIDNTAFDLPNLVEELISLHAHSEQSAHLKLASFFAADVPHQVIGDITRLRQLLNNLIGNAVKFTAQGSVSVELQLLPPADEQAAPAQVTVRLIVSDTGIGIAPKDHRRIFDPYSQQDGATNRKFGGTGLGLAISLRIIELMQGTIQVDSDIGKGSRFIVDLPFAVDTTLQPLNKPINPDDIFIIVLACQPQVEKAVSCRLQHLGLNHLFSNDLNDLAKLLAAQQQPKIMVMLDKCCFANTPAEDSQLEKQLTRLMSNSAADQSIELIQLVEPNADRDSTLLTAAIVEKPLRSDNLLQVIQGLASGESNNLALSMLRKKSSVNFHNAKVLVVEDNIVNQRVACGMLKKLGIDADIASDGAQAIEAVKQQDYDLIFMDCQMPVVDGYHATIEIRRTEVKRSLRIIALTANTSSIDIDKCKACGMDDHIAKPVRLQQMQAILQRWLPETSVITP
ncbi:MAG: hypothetical protein COA99_00545 [Moraxellaceae bacterium]|nr:MAG: hypothetical protein COA99_00545 [Moraxellaceae bacterium]